MAETSEGAQELSRRSATDPGELRREVGAVLRLPEGVAVDPSDIDIEQSDDETMIINMGPQHPSTHGVLRLMLELDGETVLRTKPVVGYLHTGMEKTGEELTYVQGSTNVTRMDYLAPLHNELVLSLAVEALLGVEMPPRSDWIRMLMVELNRVSSHLMWMATNGMDLGSTSMMIYGFREREMVLAFFEKTTGLRMNHNFIRPGGTAADLPDGWEDDVTDHLRHGDAPDRRVRRAAHRPADVPAALRGDRPASRPRRRWPSRLTGPHPAVHRRALGPAPVHALPALRRGRLRRHRRHLRGQLRPLLDPAQRDPRVDPDHPPDRREDAGRRLPGAGQEGHAAAPRPGSTSRWRRSSTTSRCSPRASRCPRARSTWPSSRPGASSAATWCPTARPSPTACTSADRASSTCRGCPLMMRGGLLADAVAVCSSVDPVMGEVDR